MSSLHPGQEVLLSTGQRGVLYARTWGISRRLMSSERETWYFLPDKPSVLGLLVMRQPREIDADDVIQSFGIRPGSWPSAGYRLGTRMRQQVYVAAMSGAPLPVPAED